MRPRKPLTTDQLRRELTKAGGRCISESASSLYCQEHRIGVVAQNKDASGRKQYLVHHKGERKLADDVPSLITAIKTIHQRRQRG